MTPATEDERTAEGGQSHAMVSAALVPEQNMGMKPISAAAKWTRRGALLASGALLCALCGCGPIAFTNDGIPPGKSKLVGRVLVADNAQQPLANLSVTVVSTPTGQPTVSYRVLTDAKGLFAVDGIVTGKHLTNGPPSVTNVVVSVDPAKTPYQAQKISLLLTEARTTEVVVALPPTSFDVNQVGQISITAPAANANGVTSGSPFQFVARLLDRNNTPLVNAQTGNYLVPSLVLDGLLVTGVGEDGTFEATGSLIGLSSITGQVEVPGASQAINSQRLSLPVQPAPATSANSPAQ